MKIIFNNSTELIIDYFSVADGKMIIKTSFSNQNEIESVFNDFLATKKMIYQKGGESETYENYTKFETITRDMATNAFTVLMAQDGKDYNSQIQGLNKGYIAIKETVNTVQLDIQMAIAEMTMLIASTNQSQVTPETIPESTNTAQKAEV